MSTPDEPLLPVDPSRPSRRKLLAAAAAAAALLLGFGSVLLLRRGESTADSPATPPADAAAPRTAKPASPRRESEAPKAEDPDERRARERYEAAEAFERAQPGEFEQRIARWREVVSQYPTTSWAKKADGRYRAVSASLQTLLDREFEGARQNAQALAAAGHYVDAIEALQTYRSAQTRDLLKRRAEVEISAVENACRLAYNEASSKARDLAARGTFAAALPLFDAVAEGAIPEVAARCRKSAEELRAAATARERFEESRKGEDARRAFREDVAPKILALVRARRYDDALRELGAAAAAPANAPIKDDLAAERASLVDASAFWEAFLKALRGRVGQDASLLLVDGRKVAGRISRVQDDKIVVEAGDAPAEVPLDRLHADLLVGWTLGRTLPAEDGLTYVKAALFFFCEGRDDLARLYLATAKELNGPAEAAEKVFRGGFLRAAAKK